MQFHFMNKLFSDYIIIVFILEYWHRIEEERHKLQLYMNMQDSKVKKQIKKQNHFTKVDIIFGHIPIYTYKHIHTSTSRYVNM